jgi:hypothetical protein
VYCMYGQLVYFIAVWYTEWSFGIFYYHLVQFFRFGKLYGEKSGSPGSVPPPRFKFDVNEP